MHWKGYGSFKQIWILYNLILNKLSLKFSIVYNEEQKKFNAQTDKQQKRISKKKDPISQNNLKCTKLIAGVTNMRTFSNLHQNKPISRKVHLGKPVYRVCWQGRVTRYQTLSSQLFENKMSSNFRHLFAIETPSERLDEKQLILSWSMTLLFQPQIIWLKKQLFSFKKSIW